MTTPRLVVRRFEATDLADYLAYQSLREVRRFLPGAAMDEGGAAAYLAAQAALRVDERGRWHGFAVEHRETGRVVGDVGVFLPREPDDEGDVGFQLHPDHQGRGLAREATEALLRHLFEGRGLRRVTAGCDPRNAASWGLMARLGMRRTAETDAGLAYALTREEWAARPLRSEQASPSTHEGDRPARSPRPRP